MRHKVNILPALRDSKGYMLKVEKYVDELDRPPGIQYLDAQLEYHRMAGSLKLNKPLELNI